MKIKTALLAYGFSGKIFHAPFIELHQGYEFIGAWERTNKRIQQEYPHVASFDTLEAVLESDADLIVVNTPIETHYEYAKKALHAGKHVLVEKAFTTTSAEAWELKELAEAKNVTLCVYQNRRYDSDFLTVKEVLEEGYLGTIVEAEFRYERYKPELNAKPWKEIPTPGTGILMDLGPHLIDQALQLFGFPEKVFADIRVTRAASRIDDYFDIVLYYADKTVRLKSSLLVKEPTPAYVLHGTGGSFLKHRGDVQEDELQLGNIPNTDTWGTEPEEKQGILSYQDVSILYPTLQGNYNGFYDELYKAIVDHKEVPVTGLDGYNTIKIIELARESARTQRVVSV